MGEYTMCHKMVIALIFGMSFLYSCLSLPDNDFKNSLPNAVDIFQPSPNDILGPQPSSNVFKWTLSKLKQGQHGIKRMWDNFVSKIKQPLLKRRGDSIAIRRQPPDQNSMPMLRSLFSKAWSFVTGFFHRSEKYFAKRRMDTGGQGVFEALAPAAPAWAMPLAVVGVAFLFRDPLDSISNELLAELDPEPVASMVPESVSSALKYLGGPSMLSYHTPSTLSSSVKPVKKLSSVVPYETKNAVSSNAISLKTTKTNDDHIHQGNKYPDDQEKDVVKKRVPSTLLASVTLNEENYSGARGKLQIVQHIEWNYVMITGTVKGLSPGIYGIKVVTGNTCLEDGLGAQHEDDSSRTITLGNIITYPFESSAIVFIMENNITLEYGSPLSILNASFVITENYLGEVIACGSVESQGNDLTFVNINETNGNKEISADMSLSRKFSREFVTISGKVAGLNRGRYGLWISDHEEKAKRCAKSDNEIHAYMNAGHHGLAEKQQGNSIPNTVIPFDNNNVNISPIPIKAEFKLNDRADSLIGHSMILYNSTNHPGPVNTFGDVSIIAESFNVLGCGVILPQEHLVAVANLIDTSGKRVSGRLIFSQIYPSKQVILIGIIYRLKFGPYKIEIDRSSGGRCKKEELDDILFKQINRAPKNMANQQADLGTIISRNSVGPTSVFLLNENISLYASSPDSIINHSITVRLRVNKYHDPSNEKNENISKESSITACGVVKMCDNQCQKSLSLDGAEI